MKKILVVEDVKLNLDLIVQLLEDEYQVITAADGVQGVAMAEKERPDLILMDMSLPKLDGWEATRQIKANPALKNIIIIGLSAHALSSDFDKAIGAGCDDYLTKPIDLDLFYEKLDMYLGD